MLYFDEIGRAEGRQLGPEPGKGAVLYHCSGEADFDGLPGDKLPLREAVKRKLNEDAPAPPERSDDGWLSATVRAIPMRWRGLTSMEMNSADEQQEKQFNRSS